MHHARAPSDYPTQSDVCTCVQSTCYYPLVVDFCQCLHLETLSSDVTCTDILCDLNNNTGSEGETSTSQVASHLENNRVRNYCNSLVLVSIKIFVISFVFVVFIILIIWLFIMFDTSTDGWSETLMVFACVNEWIINLENVHNHHEDDPSKT